jgi:hypothetical protein
MLRTAELFDAHDSLTGLRPRPIPSHHISQAPRPIVTQNFLHGMTNYRNSTMLENTTT